MGAELSFMSQMRFADHDTDFGEPCYVLVP
jgi:hypothetical protein